MITCKHMFYRHEKSKYQCRKSVLKRDLNRWVVRHGVVFGADRPAMIMIG